MVVVVKLTRCYSLLVFLVFCWSSHLVVAKDPLCDMLEIVPIGRCCSRAYAKYCCSGIPVCSDGLNNSDVRESFETLCSSPWNSTACLEGFFSTNGNNTMPCPGGYFCEENKVCLKPCPVGAYCIENTLVSDNCTGFQKCCPPSDKAPIYDSQSRTFMCAGQFYPARCKEGNYCPTTTSMLKCPSGHFCRQGSNRPIKCPMPPFCGEGETSPKTLHIGLIINGCLVVSFFLILLLFTNRHAVKFYFYLYKGRATGKRQSSHKFNITDGMRMAVNRVQNFKTSSKDELKMERKDTYNISFEKLRLKLTSGTNKGKVLLQGVTGQIKAGEVTAVLGPSGAGKTTFLNVLCGKAYYGESGGTIKINGRKVKGIQDYKSLTGFVPQDDIMHRSLTVEEVLYYNAVLRLPPQEDPQYYGKMVKKVLNLLGIRHIAYTQIGDEETRGISGGQRRRVNIGMELVADPTILFLDEPTTGLDSSSSLAVVKSLNTVASAENLTVLCVIHQPRYEILRMFDKVLFLGRGGRTVYLGSVEDAEAYFANIGFPLPPYVNPADFYMDVISGTIKNQLPRYTDLFQEWENHQNPAVEEITVVSTSSTPRPASSILLHTSDITTQINNIEESPPPSVTPPLQSAKLKRIRPGFFVQLWIFIKREFVLQLHMAKTLVLDQAFILLAGAALGLLFREVKIHNVPESTVFGNIAVGLVGVVAALRSFGHCRVVFWRESASGINRFSYFLAVNIAYIPVLLISPAVYLSIYYSVAAFLAPFSLHYLVFLCGWFYLSGLGYVMSLILTPRNSQMAAIITVVLMALLSGGSPELCKLDDTFIATAFYNLSFSRWIAEAIFEIEAAERSEVLRDIISKVQIDNHYDLTSFNTCIIALLSLGLGLRVIALLLLLFTKRGQQK